jgi:Fe-S cluster assembly ATP-binding protein
MLLEIKDLHAEIDGKEILSGVNMKVKNGELHVIMGPNGSGKTTFAKAIMGLSGAKVTKGDILIDNKSILHKSIDERAKMGLFLQYQNPVEIEGVSFINFLHASASALSSDLDTKKFMTDLKSSISSVGISEEIIKRPINMGFSGGEKKKGEILQMLMLHPKFAIFDEPDSGLDIDAVKKIGSIISSAANERGIGVIVITHYTRILNNIELNNPKENSIHILSKGRFIKEGGNELANAIEEKGYNAIIGEQ